MAVRGDDGNFQTRSDQETLVTAAFAVFRVLNRQQPLRLFMQRSCSSRVSGGISSRQMQR